LILGSTTIRRSRPRPRSRAAPMNLELGEDMLERRQELVPRQKQKGQDDCSVYEQTDLKQKKLVEDVPCPMPARYPLEMMMSCYHPGGRRQLISTRGQGVTRSARSDQGKFTAAPS